MNEPEAVPMADFVGHTLEFSRAAAALNCTALGARSGIKPISEIPARCAKARETLGPSIKSYCAGARSKPPQIFGKPVTVKRETPVIPLRAENPRRTFAIVNALLIALNIAVFIYQISLPPKAADRLVLRMGVAWWAHIGGFLLGAFLAWGM